MIVTQKNNPIKYCRICDIKLVLGDNWYTSSQKNNNYICKNCDHNKRKERYNIGECNYIDISKSTLEEYYINQKLTMKDIASIHGCTMETIWKKMKKYNISRRDSKTSRKHHSPNSGSYKVGNIPWTKGNHRSEDTKDKISNSLLGQRTGSENNLWKGGITKINYDERHNHITEEKRWRNKVYIRDDYTCQMCGQCGGDKNAHHIMSYKDYPELRFEIENGLTLCYNCHLLIHGKCSKK